MPRRLFTVTETFMVPGCGMVLIPGIAPVGNERFQVGDPLLLKRPDSSEIPTTIGSLEFRCPNPKDEVVVMLPSSARKMCQWGRKCAPTTPLNLELRLWCSVEGARRG
jgi:hypothetical protein